MKHAIYEYQSPNINCKNFVEELKENVINSRKETEKPSTVVEDVNIYIRAQNEVSNLI